MIRRPVRAQIADAVEELAVWLVPVVAVWAVASGLLVVLDTPWWTSPSPVSIGLGVVAGTMFAGYYATRRLNRLAEMEAK